MLDATVTPHDHHGSLTLARPYACLAYRRLASSGRQKGLVAVAVALQQLQHRRQSYGIHLRAISPQKRPAI
jgi:hypothetical protein